MAQCSRATLGGTANGDKLFFPSPDKYFLGSGADLVTASASSDHESGGRSGSYDYHFDRHFFDQDGVRARTPQDLRQNHFLWAK
jgi:hypothetical protein